MKLGRPSERPTPQGNLTHNHLFFLLALGAINGVTTSIV
jgi:hypothetical protein